MPDIQTEAKQAADAMYTVSFTGWKGVAVLLGLLALGAFLGRLV